MKKSLNETDISNELRGQSAFFPNRPSSPSEDSAAKPSVTRPQEEIEAHGSNLVADTIESAAVEQSIMKESNHASTLASYPDPLIDTIRKTVKDMGREVTFVRLTRDEKQHLADIVYAYKRQGVKTSENEICRIAINYMLTDYRAHGQESLLAKVIAALLA